ncbi:Tubulin--tyrosine ligase, putative, partial [Perkinsus marinus ATCC 50983]
AHEKHPSWLWIVKPPSQSRGRGIFILRDLEDLPTDSSCVISRYIVDPYLIQGYKFDLRVYVLVTGFDPLRVYLYREGLTRLACSPFTVKTAEDLQNKYAHLTNYSICRSSDDYVENRDARVDHYGHKWSLSALNRHCSCSGLDVSEVWGSIIDIILKTLVASGRFGQIGQSGVGRRAAPSCFELFGFDILLDSKLKPWLIEVNLSPSLVADTPLDRK